VALIAEQTNGPQFAFLKAISKEFDIAPQRSASAQMDAIEGFLVQQYKENKTVIVMVDEAQLLRLETLEAIRSLLNYETNTENLCQVNGSNGAGPLELYDLLSLPSAMSALSYGPPSKSSRAICSRTALRGSTAEGVSDDANSASSASIVGRLPSSCSGSCSR